jgi:PAN domain
MILFIIFFAIFWFARKEVYGIYNYATTRSKYSGTLIPPTSPKKVSVAHVIPQMSVVISEKSQPKQNGDVTKGVRIQSKSIRRKSPYFRVFRLENRNVPGYMIGGTNVNNEDECRKQCRSNPDCKWYNYNSNNKHCVLKNFAKVPTHYARLKGINRVHWYNGYQLSNHSYHKEKMNGLVSCGTKCMKDNKCHWVNYDKRQKWCSFHEAPETNGYIHTHMF